MPAILLALLPMPFFTLPVPRRPFAEVIADIERLEASGERNPAAYDRLAEEIAGGVYDF